MNNTTIEILKELAGLTDEQLQVILNKAKEIVGA